MSKIPNDRVYTEDHEWLLEESGGDGDVVVLGITDYAQEALGDVVMVELPRVGDVVEAREPFGTVESPKSVSDIFAPVGGEITAVNEALEDTPETVNDDPYGRGWMVKLSLAEGTSLEGLMDADAYAAFLEGLD